jgi:cellulose synthase/poly-beta-1,6-N-acetylglucosamine synthase-like glycosyltransferase
MVLAWLFILAVIVQCGYAFFVFVRILYTEHEEALPASQRRHVTIIICARNEAANLEQNLPAILSQDYCDTNGKPMYEVLVVNDASADNTEEVLKALEQRHSNLWHTGVGNREERAMPGKKFALSKGAAQASFSWLVLTDADCKPASNRWLALMVAPLAAGKEIVAGYGGYNSNMGLLNAFVRWETLHTFLQYCTYTWAGKPYMAVGRNMACTKKVLQKAQHADVWTALPSGDDDLLVSIAGNAENMAMVTSEDAFTYSDAKQTWSEWIKQKQRHLSTGKYYKDDVKLLLGLYATSHLDMWLCFLAALVVSSPVHLHIIVLGMLVRCAIFWGLWAATAVKLNEKKLILFFPFFDFGWLVYNFAFLPFIGWKNKQHWK